VRPNQVWATDISYIPMAKGFVHLVAIVDWFSRKVLAHRVSITMEADFCVEALEEALARYGKPEIFNTDQGSQFTSLAFTSVLRREEIAISMDGPRRMARQCRRRTPVALGEVRGGLPACLRGGQRSAGIDRSVLGFLQCQEAALELGRQDAGSGIF
jgi:hypothetical protein